MKSSDVTTVVYEFGENSRWSGTLKTHSTNGKKWTDDNAVASVVDSNVVR